MIAAAAAAFNPNWIMALGMTPKAAMKPPILMENEWRERRKLTVGVSVENFDQNKLRLRSKQNLLQTLAGKGPGERERPEKNGRFPTLLSRWPG